MIVSGVDRYIASWFNMLQKAQKVVGLTFYMGINCASGYAADAGYYVYSVTASDGTVTVTFVTESAANPSSILSLRFNGIYGQYTTCSNAYGNTRPNIPLASLQLIVVFSV